MKKVILVFILGTGMFSCFCDDVLPFWNVQDLEIRFLNEQNEIVRTDSIARDTLDVFVDFQLSYVAEVTLRGFFVNTSMALSCEDDGDDGMKDPISNIILTCDEMFNNFAAGDTLNPIVQYNGQNGFGEFVNSVGRFPAVSSFSFRVTEKPTNLDSVRFNVQLDFESGNQIAKQSEYIYWK